MPPQTHFRRSIDLFRFPCALGIVWFHMHAPGERIAYSALALFVILASYLAVASLDRGGVRRFWISRARRIALPWVAWSVFYAGVNIVRSPQPLSSLRVVHPLSLLVGPSIHLWFLPFLLLVSPVVVAIARMTWDWEGLAWLTGSLVLASVAALQAHSFLQLSEPLGQWSFAIPAVCYGLLAAEARKCGAAWVTLVYLAAVVILAFATDATDGLLQLVVAAVAFEIVWRVEWRGPAPRALGALSYGVYLVHPFFMLVYFRLFDGDGRNAVSVVLVFALSALASIVMLRMPLVSALV